MIDGLTLTRHDAADGIRVDDLVEVYLEAHRGDGPFYTEDRYRRQLDGHLRASGWTLATARVEADLAGYGYGFPLSPATRWWHGLATPLPDGFTREDGRRTFALAELLVRPAWRRRGLARALHDELLRGRAEDRATLLVRRDNAPAQTAYAKWGWRKVAELRPAWEYAPRFDVLMKDLGQAP